MRILVVESHPDDAVVGAGGYIVKLINEACPVKWIYFAPCNEDPKNKGLLFEHSKAIGILGVDNIDLHREELPRDNLELFK